MAPILHWSSGNRTTPLLIALLNGNVGLATYLFEKGADPNAADAYGRAALFAAIDLRNFNHDKYGDLPTDGNDPIDLIKALLKKGADPNAKTDTVPVHGLMQFDGSWVNFDGQTPFVRAALSGDIEVMRLLLEHGANPNIATTQGTTALMAASGINWIPGQTYSHERSRLRRRGQAVPGTRRGCERNQFPGPHGHRTAPPIADGNRLSRSWPITGPNWM